MVKSWKQGSLWDQLMLIPGNTTLLWTWLSQKPLQWRLQPLLLMTGKIIPTAYLDFPCHNLRLILFVLSGMGRFLVAGIMYIPADCCCSPLHSLLPIKQSHICCVFLQSCFPGLQHHYLDPLQPAQRAMSTHSCLLQPPLAAAVEKGRAASSISTALS